VLGHSKIMDPAVRVLLPVLQAQVQALKVMDQGQVREVKHGLLRK